MRLILAFLAVALVAAGPAEAGHEKAPPMDISDTAVGTGGTAVRHARVTVHYTGWLMDGHQVRFQPRQGGALPVHPRRGPGHPRLGPGRGRHESGGPSHPGHPAGAGLRIARRWRRHPARRHPQVRCRAPRRRAAGLRQHRGGPAQGVEGGRGPGRGPANAPRMEQDRHHRGQPAYTAFDEGGRFVRGFPDELAQIAAKDRTWSWSASTVTARRPSPTCSRTSSATRKSTTCLTAWPSGSPAATRR